MRALRFVPGHDQQVPPEKFRVARRQHQPRIILGDYEVAVVIALDSVDLTHIFVAPTYVLHDSSLSITLAPVHAALDPDREWVVGSPAPAPPGHPFAASGRRRNISLSPFRISMC
jgi:hypothetical protein